MQEMFEKSCIWKGKGEDKVLAGHYAINPAGNMVRLRPGAVRMAVSLERGEYIEGLKEGFLLSDKAEFDKREKAEAERSGKVAKAKK